jgi:hypothetical protein
MEVMDVARRLFAEGDRFASGWFDRQGRDGKIALFVCAVAPTSEEVEALDGEAAKAALPLTVVSVKYSETQLLDFYERVPDRELPAGCVSFGMDAMHNAMRLVLRRVDDEALSFFRQRIPSDALRIEIEPRAGHAVALNVDWESIRHASGRD